MGGARASVDTATELMACHLLRRPWGHTCFWQMSDHDTTERKQGSARRKKRLSAALRENLKRRKAQARGRAASSDRADNTPAPVGNADEDNALR